MLKIHKGLRKKKKDKKHKRKEEDDLFDEEELERYRREHQQQQEQQSDEQGSGGGDGTANNVPSSANSDEWQKFKALTAGIDCVLQKTQEDLDRIKSTSFFQRKPVTSEVPKVASEEVVDASGDKNNGSKENRFDLGYSAGEEPLTAQRVLVDDPTVKGEAEDEEVADESQEEEEDDIFNTSYVDAVASGELKLAYIPDSPTEQPQEEGYDPFDTSIADKFIVNNPKKRYLNLGCAVQVLSGRADKTSGTVTSAAVVASSAAKRRIVRPVQLLLDSFDEGTALASGDDHLTVTAADSPVKTLLDEDPLDFGDKSPACEVLPILTAVAPVSVSSSIPTTGACQTPTTNLPGVVASLSLAEFETFSSETADIPAVTSITSFRNKSIDSCGSLDDEFAELAQARKSITLTTAPVIPPPADPSAIISPTIDYHNNEGIDPFDTSIAEPLVSDIRLKTSPDQLLGHHSVSAFEDIEDDDFDPRASNDFELAVSPPVHPTLSAISPTSPPVSAAPSFVNDTTTISCDLSNEENNKNREENEEDTDDYDPFDTSHVTELNISEPSS